MSGSDNVYVGPEKSWMFAENNGSGIGRRDRWDHDKRLAFIAGAMDAYNGDYLDPLRGELGEANPNLELNFARLFVNKSVAFLFGQPLTYQVDSKGKAGEEREKFLETFWRRNKGMLVLQKLAQNGAIAGQAAAKLVPFPSVGEVRIRPIDPKMFDVVVAPDDFDTVVEYRLTWRRTEGQHQYRRQRHCDHGDHWAIYDEQARVPEGPWELIAEENWPFPFSAIVDCQNLPDPNCYYGYSDLEDDVLRVINRLNFVMSDWNQTLRLHAGAREWARKVNVGQLSSARDVVMDLGDDGEVGLLEMKGGMASTESLYLMVKEALHQVARIPELSVGKLDNIGRLSAVALELLYQPLLELNAQKRLTYGGMVEDINTRVLEMAGKGVGLYVRNVWPAALPTDPELLRKLAVYDTQILQIASLETVSDELGRDWEQELERTAEHPTKPPMLQGGFQANDLTKASN